MYSFCSQYVFILFIVCIHFVHSMYVHIFYRKIMESREWEEMLQRVQIMTHIAKLGLLYFFQIQYCLSFVPWGSHFPSPTDFPPFCLISNPKICSVRPKRAKSALYARSSVCFRWIRKRGWQLTKLLTKWLGICAGSLHWNKII